MSLTRTEKLKSVISAADNLAESEMPCYLRHVCGGDADLLAEAERLVAFQRRLSPFLVAASRPLQPGDRLVGRYVIERELGEDAFGLAYAARDEQLAGRRVVIKALCAGCAGAAGGNDAHDRRKLEALGHLDHPGIAGIFDRGELPGGWFLVTQFVPGDTLRTAIEKGPFYPARAMKLIRQLSAAIDFAHSASICHRDLKPENIVLRDVNSPAERAVVIGFGLAEAGPYPSPAAGSLRYMAPEQRTGRGGPSSDLYALGVIALELLTGSALLPYALTGVPEAVRVVLARATAQDPADRFSSALGFAEALAASLRPPRSCPWIRIALTAVILSTLAAGFC